MSQSQRPDTPPELREFQKKRLADIARRIENYEHQKRMRLLEASVSSLTIKAKHDKEKCFVALENLVKSDADPASLAAARVAYHDACIQVLVCEQDELCYSPK
jgi:chaperone required for assembly of F1-ATPase